MELIGTEKMIYFAGWGNLTLVVKKSNSKLLFFTTAKDNPFIPDVEEMIVAPLETIVDEDAEDDSDIEIN